MKHCRKCGGALVDEARACIHCGVRLDGEGGASDAPSAAVALLAFFFPLAGLAVLFSLETIRPLRARSARRGIYADHRSGCRAEYRVSVRRMRAEAAGFCASYGRAFWL